MLKQKRRYLVSPIADSVTGMSQARTFGVFFLLIALIAGCSRDSDREPAYTGSLYPGAGLSFQFDDKPFALAAEYGDIYSHSGQVWYNASLDNQLDSYSIADTAAGQTLAAGEITVNMLPVAELEQLARVGENGLSGRYGDVLFSASGEDGITGSAEFSLPGSDELLTVTIDGENAYLDWAGVRLDGYGKLTDDESVALRDLSIHPMARAITMVALDLGCRDEIQQLDSATFAALLFPWQVILKYEVADRGRAIPHFLAESSCHFTGFSESDSSKPLNVAVLWDNNHPIPATPFVFPFDGDGQRNSRP